MVLPACRSAGRSRPTAALVVSATDAKYGPAAEHRRQARRAAITRAHVLTAPFLGGWIAVSSLLTGLALIVLKRPGCDLHSLCVPWRLTGAGAG